MTKAEYDRKVLSLKGTHDYDMLCFIRGQYIASLEAENAALTAKNAKLHAKIGKLKGEVNETDK